MTPEVKCACDPPRYANGLAATLPTALRTDDFWSRHTIKPTTRLEGHVPPLLPRPRCTSCYNMEYGYFTVILGEEIKRDASSAHRCSHDGFSCTFLRLTRRPRFGSGSFRRKIAAATEWNDTLPRRTRWGSRASGAEGHKGRLNPYPMAPVQRENGSSCPRRASAVWTLHRANLSHDVLPEFLITTFSIPVVTRTALLI
jgi:hypothetical protein